MRRSEFFKEAGSAFRILMFNKHSMDSVARDDHKSLYALGFLLFPVVVNLILASLTVGHFSYFHSQALFGGLVVAILAIFFANYIADKGFGGTSTYMGFFRVIGYAAFVGWLNIVTYLFFFLGISGLSGLRSTISFVVGLWTLIVFYKALRIVHGLKDFDAAVVIVATIVWILIAQSLYVRLFG